MKNIELFGAVLALATAAFVSSCTDPVVEEVPVKVTVSGVGESLSFAAVNADEVNFQIQSEKAWTIAQKDCEWLTITPTDGAAGESATVTVAAADNETVGDRSGQITIQSGNSTTVIPVSQAAGAPWVRVEGLENNQVVFEPVPEAAGFTITSNVPWTIVKSNLDWCVVDPTAGEDGTTSVALVPEINNGAARQGTITIKSDAASVVITVAQAKVIPYLTIDNNSATFLVDGGSASFNVSANVAWTAVSSASWLSVTPASGSNNGTVTITAPANTSDSRTATVTLNGGDDVEPVEISVSQRAFIFEPYILAKWYMTKANDTPAFQAAQPNWVVNANKGTYEKAGWLIAEDGVNRADWYMAHNAPFEGVETYMRTNYSSGVAVNGIWKGDGMKYSVKNVTEAAGRTIAIYLGIRAGNKQAMAYWTADFSFDGGKTWVAGNSTLTTSAGAAAERLTGTGSYDFYSKYKLTEPLNGADIVIFVHAANDKDITTEGKSLAATSDPTSVAYTIRMELPAQMYNGMSLTGPTIFVE